MVPVRAVPGWALIPATAAPILLIGGWTLAAARQPGGFDAVRDTISALAARDATDRWIMTAGLAGLGVAHLGTAAALRSAARPGRLLLALGGLATLAVAAFPQPGREGGSTPHVVAAGVCFVALALWPALAAPAGARAARQWACGGAALLLALLGWFAVEFFLDGPRIGLSERMVAGAEALAPLVAVLSARAAGTRTRRVARPAAGARTGRAARPAAGADQSGGPAGSR